MEPFQLHILTRLGSKYSSLDHAVYSDNLNLPSSLNARDRVSQPHSTTGNIIVLYILFSESLDRTREDKSVRAE